jgi:hypothetical protein
VRHRRRALLAGLEAFLHLSHLGALEVSKFDRHQLARGADRGAGVQVLGVTVARDHLRGWHRTQAQRRADMALDRWRDVRVGADGAAELHHRHRLARGRQAVHVTIDLQRPQRQLGAERRRLGVDPVGAADHHGVAVPAGQFDQRCPQGDRRFEHEIGGVAHLPAERRVADIARRQPVMDPLAGVAADRRLHDVDEGRHVVVCDGLAGEHVGHEPIVDRRCAGAARCGVGDGHDAGSGVSLGGEQFDLEPARVLGGVRPDRRHLRCRIPRDHAGLTFRRSTSDNRRARRRRPRP